MKLPQLNQPMMPRFHAHIVPAHAGKPLEPIQYKPEPWAQNVLKAVGEIGNILADEKKTQERQQNEKDALAKEYIDQIERTEEARLNGRYKESPNSYEEYVSWADEANQSIMEQAEKHFSGMSEKRRAELNDMMKYRAERRMIEAKSIGDQYRYKAHRLLTEENMRGDIARGDSAAAEARLNEAVSLGLYNEGEEAKMRNYLREQTDFTAARTMIESGVIPGGKETASEHLMRKDAEGRYVNFRNLTEDQRDRLARMAKVRTAEENRKKDNAYLASLAEGKPLYNLDEMKRLHDTGGITDEQYAEWSHWYNQKKSAEQEAADKASARKRQALRARKESMEQVSDAFLLGVYTYDFSGSPDENALQKKDLMGIAKKHFGDDPEILLKVLRSIETKADDVLKGKDVFRKDEGKYLMNWMTEKYINTKDGTYKGLKWDPWGMEKDDSQEFQAARWKEVMDIVRKDLEAGKPISVIKKEIEDRVEELNDGKIRSLLNGRAETGSEFENLHGREMDFRGEKYLYRYGKWMTEKEYDRLFNSETGKMILPKGR